MPIKYQHGMEDVVALSQRAGKVQAAQVAQKQDFQLQMANMNNQMQIQAEQRRQAWELEKMEIASRMDFQQSERKRLKNQELYSAGMEAIEQRAAKGEVPQNVIDRARSELASKYYADVPEAAAYLGFKEAKKLAPYEQFLQGQTGQQEQPSATGQVTPSTPAPAYQINASFGVGEGTKYSVETPEGNLFLGPQDKVTVKDKNNNVGIASLYEVKANPGEFEIIGIGDDAVAKFVQSPEGGLMQLMDDLELSFTRQATKSYPDEVAAFREIKSRQALRKELGWQPTAIDIMWGQ